MEIVSVVFSLKLLVYLFFVSRQKIGGGLSPVCFVVVESLSSISCRSDVIDSNVVNVVGVVNVVNVVVVVVVVVVLSRRTSTFPYFAQSTSLPT